MKAVLLDTHAWAWALTGDSRLSEKAKAMIGQAEGVFVSPITFFEIGQKVRIGKWPEMEPVVGQLVGLLDEQGGRVAALTPEIFLAAATMDWSNRDPFDRIIGATAIGLGMPLISADAKFDEIAHLSGWVARLW